MNDQIITLGKYTFERAQMVQTILEADGIECYLENVNLLQAAVSSGVKVRIHDYDLERSMQLIEALFRPDSGKASKSNLKETKPAILLPVDFSDYSRKAADLAYDLALLLKAELTIIHAYFDPIISAMPFSESYIYEVNLEELSTDQREAGEKGLKKMKKYLNDKNQPDKGKEVVIKSVLLKGIAEDAIVNYSNLYEPKLIVMGTRGNDHKSTDLIGSVTAEVIEMAKVPVLAIPEDFPYNGLDSIKNVLFATSFEDSDFKAIDSLERLLKPMGVKIFCTHVVPEKSKEWDEVRMEGLKKYIEEKYQETDVECDLLHSEDFWVGIESYIRKNNIDIMCITSRRRNIISRLLNPSIAKKMLFHSTTPLLVFHT
jgi:nucleotide-binding universal stress UspA family protein